MAGEMYNQPIHPLDKLLREKRMPILFIGSGISRRYCSLDTWDSLLNKVADCIGISKFQLNGMRSQIITDNPDIEVNPKLASRLSSIMYEAIGNGQLTRQNFPDLSDYEWEMMETTDPFKVLICHMVSKIKCVDNPEILKEMESLKRLSGKVPAIITTNYDEFLENSIFKDFNVLVYPDDYYFNSSSGYGEILKIHGTASRPNSIVVTDEDYDRLKKESKVITARLTSLMCQNPVIFLGYSMSDEEIHGIILDMISSLKQTDLEKIRGHLIRVGLRPKSRKSVWNPKTEIFKDKRVEITQLDVPNLDVLYNYLDKFMPVATPAEVRRYQEMIRDIVLSTDSNSKKVVLIDIDNIDQAKPNDLAIVIGKASSIGSMMKGITGYDVRDVLLDVLMKRSGGLDVSSAHFTHWLSQKRICKSNGYAPIFCYLLKYGLDKDDLGRDSAEYIEKLCERLSQKMEEMKKRCSAVEKREDIQRFINGQVKTFPRCEALAYFFYVGFLSREECRLKLKEYYEDELSLYKDNVKISTGLRAAITVLDFKEYENRLRTETCTLSH